MARNLPKRLDTHEDSQRELTYVKQIIGACRTGDSKQLDSILKEVKKVKGFVDHILNAKFHDENTPLHVACCHGDVDCIKLLLNNGADANVFDARGFAPIHCAASNDHIPAMEVLLEFVPLNTDNSSRCELNQRSECGETPLHAACLTGKMKAAEFIYEKMEMEDIEKVDYEGNTFLHCVSCSDSGELWRWAIDVVNNRSTHLLEKTNNHGETPAHIAASLGCAMSTSALLSLKAKFDGRDANGITALDVFHQHKNQKCYSIQQGMVQPEVIPVPTTTLDTLEPPKRTLSNGSSTSPKLQRRSSMTRQKRPVNFTSLPPNSSFDLRRNSNASVKSMGTGSGRLAYEHSRSGSFDSYLDLSKDELSRLSSVNSEETIQMVLDNSAYNPPMELLVVEPVYRQSITSTNSTIYCTEHGIKFSSNYFNSKASKPKQKRGAAKPPKPAKQKSETEIPVCVAASMHVYVTVPSEYFIISPVCFVSCRCEHTCRATLELPHAATSAKKHKGSFVILSFVTFDLKASTQVESPSPQERRLEPAKVSLEVENACVRFKTTVENPCLYAVGIKCADSAIPRPLRVPLKCEVFCLYRKFVDETTISLIPIKIYVGLHLQIVTKMMNREAHDQHCDVHCLPFTLSVEKIELKSSLGNREEHWSLESTGPYQLSYSEIALTESTMENVSHSHSLSYPPEKVVTILPHDVASHVKFHLTVKDPESSTDIATTTFVPFAPPKSTTATPNSSPPHHARRQFLTPDSPPIDVIITSCTPPPGARSPLHLSDPLGEEERATPSPPPKGNGTPTTSKPHPLSRSEGVDSNGTSTSSQPRPLLQNGGEHSHSSKSSRSPGGMDDRSSTPPDPRQSPWGSGADSLISSPPSSYPYQSNEGDDSSQSLLPHQPPSNANQEPRPHQPPSEGRGNSNSPPPQRSNGEANDIHGNGRLATPHRNPESTLV